MFKYGFTEFGKDVKKRLIDLDTSQEWLISQLNRDTGLFVDSSYLTATARRSSHQYQKYSTFEGQRKGGGCP